jgi:hypothetical protein
MQKHFNAFPSLFQEIIVLFESDKVELSKGGIGGIFR